MRASISIELIFISMLIIAVTVLFVAHIFPSIWQANEELGSVVTVSLSAKKVYSAVLELSRSPIGSKISIYLILPRFSSLECNKDSNILMYRGWTRDKNMIMPLMCADGFRLEGPFRGYLNLKRINKGEVNLG